MNVCLILFVINSCERMMLHLSLVDFVLFQFFFLLALFVMVTIYLMLIPEIIFTVLGLRFHMGRAGRGSDNKDSQSV